MEKANTQPSEPTYIVSSPPHIKDPLSIESVMFDVMFALTPAVIAAFYFFGLNAIFLIGVCMVSAVLAELAAKAMFGKKLNVGDGSALLTGLLLGLCLPPTTPWWAAAGGSFAAIIIAKEAFGGLGANIFNPALVGRAVILVSWPVFATSWVKPVWWQDARIIDYLKINIVDHQMIFKNLAGTTVDAVSTATPLTIAKGIETAGQSVPSTLDLFIGNVGGSLGETSAAAILAGGLYLLYKRHIAWHIPVSYILTVGVLAWMLGKDPIFHVLAGGLFLGAFFMATDWVTTPITPKGKIIFGIGAGAIVVLIRLYGGYPEGVLFSILLMNAATPLINKYTKLKIFGKKAAA